MDKNNLFSCKDKECILCNSDIKNVSDTAVIHCLENGVRNGILKEQFIDGELRYIETPYGKKLRKRDSK